MIPYFLIPSWTSLFRWRNQVGKSRKTQTSPPPTSIFSSLSRTQVKLKMFKGLLCSSAWLLKDRRSTTAIRESLYKSVICSQDLYSRSLDSLDAATLPPRCGFDFQELLASVVPPTHSPGFISWGFWFPEWGMEIFRKRVAVWRRRLHGEWEGGVTYHK